MSARARAIDPVVAEHVATTLRALADPLRLRILSVLATSATGEVAAGEIASIADVTQPTVSHHLKVLKEVGLLESDRRGTWIYYRIAPTARRGVTSLLDSFAPAAASTHPQEPPSAPADKDRGLGQGGRHDAEPVRAGPRRTLRSPTPGGHASRRRDR